MIPFPPLSSLDPSELVPIKWREQPLLKCSGRPFVPRDEVNTVVYDLLAYGCGGCLFCRARKAAFRTTRLFVESGAHSELSFLTLTYAPQYEPESRFLVRQHVIDFLKRLRFQVEYNLGRKWPLRFDYVGEYGGRLGRPHYHVLVFGACPHTPFGLKYFKHIVEDCWLFGFVDCKEAHSKTFAYQAKYQAKGLTRVDDPALAGRAPQFSGGSRRPGIGVPGLKLMAEQVLRVPLARDRAWDFGVVPHKIRTEGRDMYLGGGAMRLLRMMVGVPEGIDDARKFLQRTQSREMYRSAVKDFFASGDAEREGVAVSNQMVSLLSAYIAPLLEARVARERVFNRGGSMYDPF